jgi:hypothetical protein
LIFYEKQQMLASFVKNSTTKIGTGVILEGLGNKWEVQIRLAKEKYNLEFGDDSNKFVVDHVLQIGDQLSLILIAESHFRVVV